MKTVKIILISLVIIIIVLWITANLIVWLDCSFENVGSFSLNKEEALKNNSLIATYKTKLDKAEDKTIRIERIMIRIPWKYIFYTPKFYSDEFYINLQSVPENTRLILAVNDTLMDIGVSPFRQLPSTLTVFFKNDTIAKTYYLDQKFQENIDKLKKIPLIDKINFGPFFGED